MNSFTDADQQQFKQQGVTVAEVNRQISIFKNGVAAMELDRPCTPGDGIIQLDEAKMTELAGLLDNAAQAGRVTKFVPASGAASRMFKRLHAARDDLRAGQTVSDEKVTQLLDSAAHFPLGRAVLAKAGVDAPATDQYLALLDAMLAADALDFGAKPKGLLPFHMHNGKVRTPVEEHLSEAEAYARDADGSARLHFTVSPEHEAHFRTLIADAAADFPDTRFQVAFSVQAPSTDTIAVTDQNEPFREDNSILFRPGGHGALIQNLDQLKADLVFIKNIDNVVPQRLADTTNRYKKVLGGLLVSIKATIDAHLHTLEQDVTAQQLEAIRVWINDTLGHALAPDASAAELHAALDRPLRVCGMVRNEGEPGGGPFWVRNGEGRISAQIVESSQIDLAREDQAALVTKATHFNPVDLVCALRNHKGEAYDLNDFIDPNTFFISEKSKNGRPLRALERPGLWNGAMAFWNTLFVEVPLITFNPVKEAGDLLRENHL